MTPHNLLIGGFLPNQAFEEIVSSTNSLFDFQWQSSRSGLKAFLWVKGNNFAQVESVQYLIIGLGHITNNNDKVGETVLREIECNLRHLSHLPIKNLEGSFSLVIVDKTRKKVTIYRNIAGLPCIYYIRNNRLTLFSDNLSCLVRILSGVIHQRLNVNCSQLPSHFLYSRIYGNKTLFNEIFRIMVGEQIYLDANKACRSQMLKLGSMATSRTKHRVESLEEVMSKIVTEYAATYPSLVNLFSGGIDSSYIQAHLSQCYDRAISTFSLDLVHPSPLWDMEREYARTGSAFFKSDHTFVKVTPSEYPKLLIKGISELGLPLVHPQTALVSKLWESIKKTSSFALCGLSADCLFGLELYNIIDIVYFIEKVIPFKSFRKIFLKISNSLNERTARVHGLLETLTKLLELDLHDYSSPKHPFNIGERSNFEAVCKLFGYSEVAKVISERQALMKQFQIEGSLKECYHSLHLLGAIQTSERFYQLASNVGLNLLFPYLDSRMIKAALSMKDDLRFQHGETKKIIKDALGNYLPKELIFRKKSAWGLPIFEWMALAGELNPLFKDYENSEFARLKFNVAKMPDTFAWSLLNFNIWYKQFFGQTA